MLDILQYEMQMFDIFIFTETLINSTIKRNTSGVMENHGQGRSGNICKGFDRMCQEVQFGSSKSRKCVGLGKYPW